MTEVLDPDVWERPAPADLVAEAAVLGAVLLSPGALTGVAGVLGAEDFYRPSHQVVFAHVLALYEAGLPVDAVTVAGSLARSGELKGVGGGPALHDLTAGVASTSNAEYYARMVHEKAIARRLSQAGTRIHQLANGPGDVDEIIAGAETALAAAVTGRVSDDAALLTDLLDAVIDDLDSERQVTGIPTGYLDLDLSLNPLEPGQLVIIGARPSIGKSTMGLDLARHTAIRLDLPCYLASFEMGTQELVRRTLSAEAKIPLERIQRHQLSEEDWTQLAVARARLQGAPLTFDAPLGGHTLGSLRAAIRRHKPQLVVLDYLQLMTPPKAGDRRESIEALTRGLKLLAKAEGIPVVVLAQLNRQAESRHDKRPNMADLRESGSIEQDADVVILLHRPDFYDPEDQPGEVQAIIAKQRNGPTVQVTLSAQLHYSRFTNMAGWQS